MVAGKTINDSRNETRGHEVCRADAQFARGRVGEKFNTLHTLAQIIEHGRSAMKEGAAKLGWLDALTVAV